MCEPVKRATAAAPVGRCLSNALSPAIAGSNTPLIPTWGSLPRLYASTRFAGCDLPLD